MVNGKVSASGDVLNMKKTAKLFQTEREKQKLTTRELADRAGISHPRIVDLESGKGNPTIGTLEKIARALKKSLKITLG